jgi:hypothetical protein
VWRGGEGREGRGKKMFDISCSIWCGVFEIYLEK